MSTAISAQWKLRLFAALLTVVLAAVGFLILHEEIQQTSAHPRPTFVQLQPNVFRVGDIDLSPHTTTVFYLAYDSNGFTSTLKQFFDTQPCENAVSFSVNGDMAPQGFYVVCR